MTKPRRIALNVSIFVTAALASGGFFLRSSAHFLDARYVHADAFTTYQQGEASQRQKDSLVTSSQLTAIDTALAQLVRACRHRGECP